MMRTDTVSKRIVCFKGPAKRDACRQYTIGTGVYFRMTGEYFRRSNTSHIDETAKRVRAIATALRAAKNLDLLNVEQRGNRANTAEIDIVNQKTN